MSSSLCFEVCSMLVDYLVLLVSYSEVDYDADAEDTGLMAQPPKKISPSIMRSNYYLLRRG